MWKPIETYQKDGTLVLLLVDYSDSDSCNALENKRIARTVGFNNLLNDGEDKWNLAGWDWGNDYFCEGYGTPTMWQPFPPE